MKLAALLVLAAGCQYGAAFSDCEIPCHAPDECPATLTCGAEGLCRINGNTISCMAVLGDAHKADAASGDAPPGARCTGTPTACATLTASTACTAQTGCTYTTTKCKLTVDCTQAQTSTDCENTPGCYVDVVMPYCKGDTSYCTGTTKSTCEQKQNCGFSGGCSGTPKPCTDLTTSGACSAQAGCTWH